MSIIPIITFKAGICDVDQSSKPYKVKAQSRPGYIYLYSEDDLIHFCWRERSVPLDEPELDLVMIPEDGHFFPYDTRTPKEGSAKTNGRIFVLKFNSSSQRHLFWLQSKPQGRNGDPAWLSPRDLKIGEIVDKLLQGEQIDVTRELAKVRNNSAYNGRDEDDDDETMEDAQGHGDANEQPQGGSGGAGPDATGGDIRREGEDAREGGADGGRAANSSTDAAAAVRNFLASLQGSQGTEPGRQQAHGKLYPLLTDLLEPLVTVPMADSAPDAHIDQLLALLPPTTLVLAQQGGDAEDLTSDPSEESARAAMAAMSSAQKRSLLKKVLRSPQFTQSLASLSAALRDGGLPSIAEALDIKIENGGIVRGGNVPLGGGEAIEAFVQGVKRTVEEK